MMFYTTRAKIPIVAKTGNGSSHRRLGDPWEKWRAYDMLPEVVRFALQQDPDDYCPVVLLKHFREILPLVGGNEELAGRLLVDAHKQAIVGDIQQYAREFEAKYNTPYPSVAANVKPLVDTEPLPRRSRKRKKFL